MNSKSVPELPVLRIRLRPAEGIAVFIDEHGTESRVEAGQERVARRALLDMAQDVAIRMNRPVRVATSDETGVALIAVAPDGQKWVLEAGEPLQEMLEAVSAKAATPKLHAVPSVEEAPAAAQPREPDSFDSIVKDLPEFSSEDFAKLPPLQGHSPAYPAKPSGIALPADAPALPSRKSLREADARAFVRADVVVEPAAQGWRGILNNLVPSLSLGPGQAETQEREWVRLVARHYALTRTVAVINQKGGVGKTPSTACLSAVFGRSGGSVLAWDNNETSGSLGKRTEPGDHDCSVLDVLGRADHLLSDAARAADINGFVHRQITDRYDVLRSDPDLLGTHEITAVEVDTLHAAASKFYNVVLMDSGNNHRASNWNRMIDHADQLVVPVTINDDDVSTGLETLKGLALRSERSNELAGNAVVIVSQKAPGQQKAAEHTAGLFAEYVRDVVTIPFDPALVSGVIRFGALQPATRLAWLKSAAAVAKGL